MNFTVRQLAARWVCSEEHVRRLIRANQLRAFKVGTARGTRISAQEVEKWEAEHLTQTEASRSGGHPVGGSLISLI
jgi:excisionase family DNA binding protein